MLLLTIDQCTAKKKQANWIVSFVLTIEYHKIYQ